MDDFWPRLEAQLQEHAPDLFARLRPGASEAQLVAYEAASGQNLPANLRTAYLRHDGCNYVYRNGGYSPGALLGRCEWIPLADSLAQWETWNRNFDEADPYFYGSDIEGWDGLKIRPWQSPPPTWIPVGKYLGYPISLYIDLSPGPIGTPEQLIGQDTSGHTTWVEAVSWEAYLRSLTEGLERGSIDWVLDEDSDAWRWRSVATGELFTGPGHDRVFG